MIKYSEVNVGDILRVVGAGAPGYYKLGDLVRVLKVEGESCLTEATNGYTRVEFVFNCGAARLEPTEWKEDFKLAEKEITV